MPKAKNPRPKNRDEDLAQSQRFLAAASDAVTDGGLSPTEAEAAFERLTGKVLPPRKKPPQDPEAT